MHYAVAEFACFSTGNPFHIRPRKGTCCYVSSSVGERPLVQGPPDGYDMRSESISVSRSLVSERYPELLDLVEEGTLVVVPRSKLYKERRTDGYVEPEEVYIIGTAHLSKKSAEDVHRVVSSVQPENVVVELCKSRSAVLYQHSNSTEREDSLFRRDNANNLLNLSGSSLPSALNRTLSLGGRNALLLRILLAGLSDRLSKQAGVVSGVEFRAAQEAAEEVGAQVVLGDRPIEITLRRAWSALSLPSKLQLMSDLVRAGMGPSVDLTQDLVERLKSDDVISVYFKELGTRYPQLLSPLIHERDLYLAWSLQRSKAVGGTGKVVGVVGRGHLRGVVYSLTHLQGKLRFKDLVGTREERGQGSAAGIARRVAVEVVLGVACYLAWVTWVSPVP